MKLVYYKKSIPNFGDDLNLYLWPKLEPTLFDEESAEAFIGIGTIIGMRLGDFSKLNVVSSGAGNDPIERWGRYQVNYIAVRGPISASLLGLPPMIACTDGAILSPLVWNRPSDMEPAGTIIIPHWETLEHPGWTEVERMTGFQIVDPRSSPDDVIGRIMRSKLVITESLHGAILADTYGVPWIPFATSGNFATGKWVDWTMSVGLPFDLWVAPPPSASTLTRFGQLRMPYNQTSRIDAEAAHADMQKRMQAKVDAPASAMQRLKAMIKKTPIYQSSLRLSAERTAESLLLLSKGQGYLSEERLRSERADDLRERLRKLSLGANRAG